MSAVEQLRRATNDLAEQHRRAIRELEHDLHLWEALRKRTGEGTPMRTVITRRIRAIKSVLDKAQ